MTLRYSGDYTINHFTKVNDEYTKTANQVPFFLYMMGPPTIKKRDKVYVATTCNPDKVVS